MDLVAVRALLQSVVAVEGCELYHLEWKGGILRLLCDRPGGADLDTLSRLSTAAEASLDGTDPIQGAYVLEVSSPGLERPLCRPDHWTRLLDTQEPWTVAVKTRPDVEGERRVTGLLEAADEDGCTVAGRLYTYDQIESAHTVFVWGAKAKPGGKSSSKGGSKSTGRKKSKRAATAASEHPSPDTPRSAQA